MQLVSPLPQRARNGTCVNCGTSSSKRRYFDLKVFIDFEGALFICEQCIEEMGNQLGLVTEKYHESVKANNQKLLAANRELRERLDAKNEAATVQAQAWVDREVEHATELANARTQAIQETEARYAK